MRAMFVMSYFRSDSESLFLAVSDDGLRWTPLCGGQPVPLHQAPPVRDPHLSRDRNGLYHLLYTDGWHSTALGHSTSPNLRDWSAPEAWPVMDTVPGTRNCWAPECIYDPDAALYRVFWSSTVSTDPDVDWTAGSVWNTHHDHRIWQVTSPDMVTFGPPSLFFDPGYSVIDATIAQDKGAWLMAVKDERGENQHGTAHKDISVYTGPAAGGPWTLWSDGPASPLLTEGPALFRRGGMWTLFYDHFHEGFHGAAESRDGRTWTSITERVAFPPGPRHVSVLTLDDALEAVVVDGLRRALLSP